jgi:hypothetical protein
MSRSRALLASIVAVVALLAPGLAQAKWMKAETERFVVYSNGDEWTLREYAVKLEDFETLLRMFFALKPEGAPPRKFEIYLVSNTDELRRVAPRASESLAGFYTASPNAIFAVAIRARGDGDEDDTIFHEYAHHFMMQYLAGSYPGWLVEGFAEYYMTARLKPGSFEIGTFNSGRAYTLLNGPWTPTEVVLTRRTSDLRRDQVFGYYAQSWLMTHYMLADPAPRQQLFAYVRLVAQGKESAAAWVEATGESIEAFDARLKVYMRKGIPSVRFKRTAYTPAPVTITVLPPSADDLLLESLRATLGGFRKPDEPPETDDEDEEGPKAGGKRAGRDADAAAYERERLAFIDRVRTRAAKYPTDGLAQRTLARVELEGGDKAAGVAILDRLIAADAQDAEALRLKAEVVLADAYDAETYDARRALLNEAGRLFLKANRIQPNEYRTLFGYAISRQGERDYPNDNVLDVFDSAVALAPQVDDIRIAAARAFMRRKLYSEAVPLLLPVANDPHGGPGSEIARVMLKEIEAERAKGA